MSAIARSVETVSNVRKSYRPKNVRVKGRKQESLEMLSEKRE